MSTGYGGYTREHGLDPDILTVGKTIGGGVPAGAFGLTREVAERALAQEDADYVDVGGVGGTLAGNALSVAAMRTALTEVLTDEAFGRTVPLARRFERGVKGAIEESRAPWNVVRLGCRVEYGFSPEPPRNGGEAAASHDDEFETLAAPVRAQPRGAHNALPQHGPDGPDDHGGAGGPAHGRLLGGAG